MTRKSHMAYAGSIIAACSCITAEAQISTNLAVTYYSIGDSYAHELETRGTAAYINGFGYPSMDNWTIEEDTDGYKIHARVASAGKSVMRRTVLYSLRETAAEMPLSLGWRNWAENLFAGTIGNTVEGEINTLSPTPTADEASYWKQLQSAENLSLGFRPFDGNPYVYTGMQLGHSGGDPAAITLIRWHYDILRMASKIDAQISFPLPGASQLSVGTSFQPERIGKAGCGPGFSARWIRTFGHGPFKGNCFVGAEFGNSSQIDWGINFPF